MKHHAPMVLTLACVLVAGAGDQLAWAQGRLPVGMQDRPRSTRLREPVEELPRGNVPYRGPVSSGQPHAFMGEGFGPIEIVPDTYGDDCGPGGCGDNCAGDPFGGGWYPMGPGGDPFGHGIATGQAYFIADYLYVRASFSDAVAFGERLIESAPQLTTDRFQQLDFQYDSSYRLGGGYRLASCGPDVRFLFARMASFADASAGSGAFLPFDPSPLDDESARVHSFVDVESYDLEFRKTIPLGAGTSAGCGDSCCGNPCSCGPTWDIIWSGGLRFAEVDWNRSYSVTTDDGDFSREFRSILNFEGGGPRLGVKGRYYGGQGGWFHVFLKGDVSLLFGHLELDSQRRVESGVPGNANDDIFAAQSVRVREIIPVTEIETGLAANITRNTVVTAGYLFSAWHDLGFRDEFEFVSALQTRYDDANLLGFDGFFARLEVSY